MKKYYTVTILLSVFFSLSIVSAEVIGDVAPDQASEGCTDLSYNLTYKKSKDANTNGEVSDLQYFLQDQGLLRADPNGLFGPSTLRAVKSFQRNNGLSSSGYVGPITRAKIKEISCNGDVTVSPSRPVACTMDYRSCADGSAMPRDADCKWREDKCSSLPISKNVKTGTLRVYSDINASANVTKENVSKDDASNGCKEWIYSNPNKQVRCTWDEVEFYDTFGKDLGSNPDYNKKSSPPSITSVKQIGDIIYIYGERLNLFGNVLNIDGSGNSDMDKYKPTSSLLTLDTKKWAIVNELSEGYHKITVSNFINGDSNNYSFYFKIPSQVAIEPISILKIEAHGPNYNAMSCSNPSKSGLSQGQVACYGIWDYGNEFGGDPDMCPPYGYSSSQTGCKVITKACLSGQAIATRVVNPTSMDVNSSDIATFATNLKSSKEAVKQQIPTLWEYTCDGFVSVNQSTLTENTYSGPGAVTTWKKLSFSTYNNQQDCTGDKYVGYSQKYNSWVGAQLCGVNTKYKLYMSDSENGTYYQIADTGGHGQDHCELINSSFTIPNDDDITSGTCKNCSLGEMFDVQNEPVYVRSKIGESFKKAQSSYWADLTTKSYSCGVSIGGSATDIQVSPVSFLPNSENTPVIKVSLSDTARSYAIGQMIPFKWTTDNLTAILKETNGALWAGAYVENVATGKRTFLGDAMSFRGGDAKKVIPLSSEGVTTVPGDYKVRVYLYAQGGNKAEGYSEVFTITAPSTPTLSSITPTSGPAGTIVTIKGSNFASNNFFKDNVMANFVSSSNMKQELQTIEETYNLCTTSNECTFSVKIPGTLVSGVYAVSVKSVDKVSNSISFTVTGTSTSASMGAQSSLLNMSPQVLGVFSDNSKCLDISSNLHRGAESSSVTTLQKFLQDKGLLNETPSGFYGDKTVEAVKDYQASKDLPVTGMVYDFTRQAIKNDTCQ